MNRRGVTLIELLISVSLLSILSLAMLMALRVGLTAMDRTNARLVSNRRAASVERILASEIAQFVPAWTACMPAPNQPPVRVPFFQGQPQAMRFVSGYSLEEAGRGLPRILEFHVEPGENGEGVRLLVNEMLYTGPDSSAAVCAGMAPDPEIHIPVPLFRPIETGPRSFVLADKLAFCRFLFRENAPPPELERWVPVWRLPQWPTGVRVEMAPLAPDPARVPLIGATVAIPVDRLPNASYKD